MLPGHTLHRSRHAYSCCRIYCSFWIHWYVRLLLHLPAFYADSPVLRVVVTDFSLLWNLTAFHCHQLKITLCTFKPNAVKKSYFICGVVFFFWAVIDSSFFTRFSFHSLLSPLYFLFLIDFLCFCCLFFFSSNIVTRTLLPLLSDTTIRNRFTLVCTITHCLYSYQWFSVICVLVIKEVLFCWVLVRQL